MAIDEKWRLQLESACKRALFSDNPKRGTVKSTSLMADQAPLEDQTNVVALSSTYTCTDVLCARLSSCRLNEKGGGHEPDAGTDPDVKVTAPSRILDSIETRNRQAIEAFMTWSPGAMSARGPSLHQTWTSRNGPIPFLTASWGQPRSTASATAPTRWCWRARTTAQQDLFPRIQKQTVKEQKKYTRKEVKIDSLRGRPKSLFGRF